MADVPDIRLLTSLRDSAKRWALVEACGDAGFRCLIDLWLWARVHGSRGALVGLKTPRDVERAARWDGDRGAFFEALTDDSTTGNPWLETAPDGTFILHDWWRLQGYAAAAQERSTNACVAATLKAARKDGRDLPAFVLLRASDDALGRHYGRRKWSKIKEVMRERARASADRNAPVPAPRGESACAPSPSPPPSPSPLDGGGGRGRDADPSAPSGGAGCPPPPSPEKHARRRPQGPPAETPPQDQAPPAPRIRCVTCGTHVAEVGPGTANPTSGDAPRCWPCHDAWMRNGGPDRAPQPPPVEPDREPVPDGWERHELTEVAAFVMRMAGVPDARFADGDEHRRWREVVRAAADGGRAPRYVRQLAVTRAERLTPDPIAAAKVLVDGTAAS